jgi:hypothetical protein
MNLQNSIFDNIEKMIPKFESLLEEKANVDDIVYMYECISNIMANILTVI